MKLTITPSEIREVLNAPPPELPTYVSPILNLANRFAGGTKPRVVGQMSELIQQFEGRTIEEWAEWYQQKYPTAVADAVVLVRRKLDQFKRVIDDTTDEMIESWVRDLVLVKTFIGLRFQGAVLQKVSQVTNLPVRLATPEEEARGIDGVVGTVSVSIKPSSWRDQVIQHEQLQGVLIYYTKVDDGIEIDFDPAEFH